MTCRALAKCACATVRVERTERWAVHFLQRASMAQNEREEALAKLRKALLTHKEVDAKVHASTP